MAIILSDRKYPESFITLEKMGVPLITEERARSQDIRPLRIGLLNLMPTAVLKDTEEQFLFFIGSTPLQIIPELISFDLFTSSEKRKEHLDAFYRKFSSVQKEGLDGLIVTGANIEEYAFEDVHYWDELKSLLTWAREHVASTLYSCWAAHAALKLFYDIDRESYTDREGKPRKITGVFPHNLTDHLASPFTQGLPDTVLCPHSRWKGIPREKVAHAPDLTTLLENDDAGILLISGRDGREVYIQGHPEYAADALRKEYARDQKAEAGGHDVPFPVGYFPGDDIEQTPSNVWRGNGTVFFRNWINFVYQTTHFELGKTMMEKM
jgi:homoserine O-succinyltransferase